MYESDQAASYTVVNAQQRHDAENITDEFEEQLGEISGRCLDVGTGPGDVLIDFILPKLDPRATVVCSDISDSMLEFCKEKYGDNERLSFEKLDIQTLDLPKHLIGQFDIVTSFYCLHWCLDLCRAFENIFNILRPGGTSLLTFIAKQPIIDVYPILAELPRYSLYTTDCDRYIPLFQYDSQPRKGLKSLAKNVGFEVIHCSCRENNHFFRNADAMKKFLTTVNPFMARMSSDLRKEYQDDLMKETLKRMIIFNKENNGRIDESILSTFHLFVVHLKKPS